MNHTAVAHHNGDDHHSLENETSDIDSCETTSGEDQNRDSKSLLDGPFDWNENIQGLILAGYFYGYIVTQVPGGWVAEKFSAKHVFGAGTLLNIICTLITPIASKLSYGALIALRILMGIGGVSEHQNSN